MKAATGLFVDERGVAVAGLVGGEPPGVAPFDVEYPPIWLPREPDELRALAGSVGEALKPLFPNGMRVRLAIPASWCLCQIVECEGAVDSEKAAAYTFEEDVPIDLEQLTIGTSKLGPKYSLVVGVYTEPFRVFLRVLQELHIEVESLTVDVAMALLSGSAGSLSTAGATVISDTARVSVSAPGTSVRPPLIRTFAPTNDPRHLEYQSRVTEVLVGGTVAIERLGTDQANHPSDAAGVAPGRVPIDLRRGALAYSGRWRAFESALRSCALSSIVLFAILCGRNLWDHSSLDAALAALQQTQSELYQRAFPGAATPGGASLRLQSERIRLEGLTKSAGFKDVPGFQTGMNAFLLLHELTARIPAKVKLHVNELEIDSEGIRVAGQAKNHAAAGDWVQEINRSAILQADPPRSQLRKDGTVDFRIHARIPQRHDEP